MKKLALLIGLGAALAQTTPPAAALPEGVRVSQRRIGADTLYTELETALGQG